jgi:flagellar hook protein FlgE
MLYMDVSTIALQGLQQAQAQFDAAAQRVAGTGSATPAGASVDTVSLSDNAVAMLSAKSQFAANLNVLKIADNMQKNLVNLLG